MLMFGPIFDGLEYCPGNLGFFGSIAV